ncbi:hypothetical protein VTJ83DRAFT_613 [Remersonia thermophila]|uniref:Uncharacterized protein n=1 Tax=Remersonia thermophila TaxID=72144 RepID=A0ABR4DLQ2_9PEZI
MATVPQLRLFSLRGHPLGNGIPLKARPAVLKRCLGTLPSVAPPRSGSFTSPSITASPRNPELYRTRSTCYRRPDVAASLPIGRRIFSTQPARKATQQDKQQESPPAPEEPTTTATEPPPSGGKAAYPDRLIIYHAGTGRTTFLACLKVTTLFIFGFFDLIMTPAYLAAGEPLLKTAGVALCGIVPAVYVAWTTSPFVAAVHVYLPPYARWSRAILERFARSAPPNTRIDVTTMSLIGKPRVSSMVLSDLRPAVVVAASAASAAPSSGGPAGGRWRRNGLWDRLRDNLGRRLGTVNYVRDTTVADRGRKWWRFRAVGQFFIRDDAMGSVKNGWVWKELREGIAKRAAAAEAASQGKMKTKP